MKTVPIIHQKTKGTEEPKKEDFTIHVFPYSDLAPVSSHLLPHFVIFNAGKKVVAMQKKGELLPFLEANAHVRQDLITMLYRIADIYDRWIKIGPTDDWLKTPPPAPRAPPSHSSRASTEPRRTPRRPAEDQHTPTRTNWVKPMPEGGKSGGQQGDLEGSVLLETKSMKKLDRRSEHQIFDATMTRISNWRKGVVDAYDGEAHDSVMEGNVGVAGWLPPLPIPFLRPLRRFL